MAAVVLTSRRRLEPVVGLAMGWVLGWPKGTARADVPPPGAGSGVR
jgi:hypothetical protein